MPTTRVIIARNGKVVIEGIGYIGDACLADAEALVEALRRYGINVDIKQVERKEEAYVEGKTEIVH